MKPIFSLRLIRTAYISKGCFSLRHLSFLPTHPFYSVKKDVVVRHVARMNSIGYKFKATQSKSDSLEDLSLDAVTNQCGS
jgi:hypothetical protein